MYRFITRLLFRLRRRFTSTGALLVSGVVMSAGLGVDTYRTFTHQIFTLLLSILVISFFFCFSFRGKFSIQRKLPRFGTVDQELEYSLLVTNQTDRTQQGLVILENVESVRTLLPAAFLHQKSGRRKMSPGSVTRRKHPFVSLLTGMIKENEIPPMLAGGVSEVKTSIKPDQRGFMVFQDVIVAKPDPFNILRSITKVDCTQSLLILPKRYHLPPFDLPGSRKYQPGGVNLAYSVGDAEEFAAMRDYRPGDPLRRIHWRSWAKTGKPIVKEYEEEFYVRHALIMDTFFDTEANDIFEEAVSMAASFVCSLRTQESLLDLMFVGPEAYCFTSGRGLNSVDKMLEILASVRPCFDKSFSYLTSLVRDRLDQLSGCICIFIRWNEERERFLSFLELNRIPVVTFLLCPDDKTAAKNRVLEKSYQGRLHVLSTAHLQEELDRL